MTDKCILDDYGGKKHPYGYCLKPIEEMIDYDKIKDQSGPFNMVGISEAAKGLISYSTALIGNPSEAISKECDSKLGNRYVIRSKLKCKNMTDQNVHVFINNMIDYNHLSERKDKHIGIIPATIGSALKINGLPLIKALYEDPEQNCIKVDLPCHVVEKKKGFYSTTLKDIPITVSQYDELEKSETITPTAEQKAFRDNLRNQAIESYSNLHDTIYNYLNNNSYLIPSKNLESANNNDTHNNDTHNNNNNNNNNNNDEDEDEDDLLFNLYYLFLSILLLFILFKIINKK